MSVIAPPGKPGNPTRVELHFYSNGRMTIIRTAPDGTREENDFPVTTPGLLLAVSANPGGLGLLDASGMHDASLKAGAYFAMEVRRVF